MDSAAVPRPAWRAHTSATRRARLSGSTTSLGRPTVTFERMIELQDVIERRRPWHRSDGDWSCLRWMWSPSKKAKTRFSRVDFRHRVRRPETRPIQPDLFRPVEREFEFEAVLTEKLARTPSSLATTVAAHRNEASPG